MPDLEVAVQPLTSALWPAIEDLFGEAGGKSGCWCMYWRIGSRYRSQAPSQNKAELKALVERGPPPGLLALAGGIAVGWCQITPRSALPWIDQTWRLKRVDDLPVWSLSCFYIRKGYRKQGIASQLIEAAIEFARRNGAPAVEAYPIDATQSPSSSSTGFVSTFERLGFSRVPSPTVERPILRLQFD